MPQKLASDSTHTYYEVIAAKLKMLPHFETQKL